MVSAKKSVKKAPGRPRKAPEDRLEQFSIRLSPKLKFGLEMLARAQNRSLSQAVEWAVQVGMNSFDIDRQGTTLGELINGVWMEPTDAARTLRTYRWAPTLLAFEDLVVCEMLEKSVDLRDLWREADRQPGQVPSGEELEQSYWAVVLRNWDLLRGMAIERANSGKPTQNVLVAALLGLVELPAYKTATLSEIYSREAEKMSA